MPSSTRPAWLQADKRQIKVISSGCTPSSHICAKCLRASLPCPCMANPPSMAFQVTTPRDGILLNTLQASSMLPHFAYMSTKLLPTKTSDSKPLWMSCLWTNLPSSSAPNSAHALTPEQNWMHQDSFLLVAFAGKAALPSYVAHPSHIL